MAWNLAPDLQGSGTTVSSKLLDSASFFTQILSDWPDPLESNDEKGSDQFSVTALGMEMGMRCGMERLMHTTHLPWNSHTVFTTDILSGLKQIPFYIPQGLSLDKILVSENQQRYTANISVSLGAFLLPGTT